MHLVSLILYLTSRILCDDISKMHFPFMDTKKRTTCF